MKVFVYGTLKKGKSNHYGRLDINGSKFLSKGRTKNKYNMIAHGFPMVTKDYSDEDDNYIQGELYEVTEEVLTTRLDPLEGHPRLFKREITEIENENGEIEEAWMYFYKHDGTGADKVPSGNFDDHLAKLSH